MKRSHAFPPTSRSPKPLNPTRVLLRDMARTHKTGLLVALGLNLVVGASVAFQNLIPKFIIDDALLKEGLDVEQRRQRLILLAGFYVFVGIFLRASVYHASLRIFSRIREKCVSELRSRFFHHVNRLCISFHSRHNSGELFNYLFGTPLMNVQQYFSQMAMAIPYQAVSLVMTLLFLARWDLLLTSVIFISVGLHFWFQVRSRLRVREIHRDYQQTEARVSGKVADLLRGHRALKLHGVEDHADQDFGRELTMIHDKSYRRDVFTHFQHMKQESLLYIGYAILCTLAGWRFLEGHITEGQLTAYLTSYIGLQSPLNMFFQVALLRGGAQASMDRISALLSTESTTPEPATDSPALPTSGDLTLENVVFGYDNEPVLHDLSLSIPYGQKVALVGPSGAGKSTIAQLLLRLYDPDQGRVLFNGTDIRSFPAAEYRRSFGVVPQDPYMFNCSLRENLTLVAPGADDARLREVCEQANAWEFIRAFPEGLDTRLGEGGSHVSGGQRQRLAIARALLSNPSIFVFDEATSALDTLSEQLIKEAMERVSAGRTAIFIAHRLASIETCDRILVVENGRITQDGTYGELSALPGTFQNLLRTQTLAKP
ncbi:MAG: ABC transporter ATP-binding protein [Verrucomicrobia bacterium]|nr:ABC transporter ATP-binding protein [Verrucomicrobiota bacterium]MCH8510716.1 ABC transporter ATP-binding protein/permease [Kiritimatiellia bacterium]